MIEFYFTRTVSFRLKKRFPTLEHLVHAGIMREDEFRYKINRFPTLEHLVHAGIMREDEFR
jgi:hypothetical protein